MVCEKQKINQYVHIWKLLVYISCKRLLSQFLKLDRVCVCCELEHDYRITNWDSDLLTKNLTVYNA